MLTVLASVTDKTGLEKFLRGLEKFHELKVIGTTSTACFLEEQGFSCIKVEELTKFPEILSGRVKTLHPKVFAGILSRPSQEDRDCLASLDIQEIDLVIVNLYRFEDKLKENLSERDMIEQIDIGGVSLLRAAGKNFERVAVVSMPEQYERVLASIEASSGEITLSLRKDLALEAFARTAAYDRNISSYLSKQLAASAGGNGKESDSPSAVDLKLTRIQSLRYGENPHQAAGWYNKGTDSRPFEQLQGKEMSFNNIVDTYALVSILADIQSPGACVIKHNNPCGVAVGNNIHEVFDRAYECDPLSAFGGVYGFTEKVDAELARKITEGFVEIVLAPDFDPDALDLFKKKKNIRVLKLTRQLAAIGKKSEWQAKDLGDFGVLLSRDAEEPVCADKFQVVTETRPDKAATKDIAFAWSIVKHLTSNAIFVAKEGCSLGFGIGQTSRIRSSEIALEQAGENANGAVLASDAFFPATDNIEAAGKAGIKVIVQPGGSIKDKEVIKACDDLGIAMLFTGQRCFKH